MEINIFFRCSIDDWTGWMDGTKEETRGLFWQQMCQHIEHEICLSICSVQSYEFDVDCKFLSRCIFPIRIFICDSTNATQVFNIIVLDLAIPEFWPNYAKAISALLFGPTIDWYKHSSVVFPKQAKCFFYNYGPSGTMQRKDSLCLLPLNNINEKIFVVIWIWYIVLLTITILNGIYVALSFTNKNLRLAIVKSHTMLQVSNKQINQATNNGHLGDCFVLKQMARSLNPIIFIEIMEDLSIERSSKFNDY